MAKWGEIKCPRCAELKDKLNYAVGEWRDYDKTIEQMEAKLRKSALQELSALGQASEAYQAQLAAEAKLAKAVMLIEIAVELGRWELNPSFRDKMIDFAAELTGGKDE